MAYSGEGFLIEAVVLNDPNKTVIPVVCDEQGQLLTTAVIAQPSSVNSITTPVSAGDSSTPIVGVTIGRQTLIITNDEDSDYIYLALGTFVSPGFYMCRLKPGCMFSIDNYAGPVSALCVTRESSTMYVTEVIS